MDLAKKKLIKTTKQTKTTRIAVYQRIIEFFVTLFAPKYLSNGSPTYPSHLDFLKTKKLNLRPLKKSVFVAESHYVKSSSLEQGARVHSFCYVRYALAISFGFYVQSMKRSLFCRRK